MKGLDENHGGILPLQLGIRVILDRSDRLYPPVGCTQLRPYVHSNPWSAHLEATLDMQLFLEVSQRQRVLSIFKKLLHHVARTLMELSKAGGVGLSKTNICLIISSLGLQSFQ